MQSQDIASSWTDQSKHDERKYFILSTLYKNDYPLDFINKVLQLT
jgi:hypothetical protein